VSVPFVDYRMGTPGENRKFGHRTSLKQITGLMSSCLMRRSDEYREHKEQEAWFTL